MISHIYNYEVLVTQAKFSAEINWKLKIKLGRKNYTLEEVFFLLPKKYEIMQPLDLNDIDSGKKVSFDFEPLKKIEQKNTLRVTGKVASFSLDVIVSKKLSFAFSYNKPLKLRGILKEGSCLYPEIVFTEKGIVPIYEDFSSGYASRIVKTMEDCLPSLAGAYRKIHQPLSFEEVNEGLNYLFNLELNVFSLLLKKGDTFREPLLADFDFQLPFELTKDQKITWLDIKRDLEGPLKSCRLVFGDVGCGKTAIALLAALKVVANHKKVLYLAPTVLLATQVYERWQELVPSVKFDLICGNKKIQNDKQIFIGTSALLFRTFDFIPGLLIVDEQHRFGVAQRNYLRKETTDMLMMTATPIPRTLLMVLGKQLSFSEMKEAPTTISRKTVVEKADESFKKSIGAIACEQRVIWICKTIKEAEERFEEMSKITSCYLLHSKKKDKNEILQNFLQGLLISTTVIEVGIDIDCSYIVIENADQFGLSQIHQLRGRVGRRNKESVCFLLGKNTQKLKQMVKAETGAQISQLDLKKRGGGTFCGKLQSGFHYFRFGKKCEEGKMIDEDSIDHFFPLDVEEYICLFNLEKNLKM